MRRLLPGLALACMAGAPLWAETPRRLPAEVRAFIARRDMCDHLRGEDSPDPSRMREIARALDRYCKGTDAALARLKRAYARDPRIIGALAGYDPDVEGAK